jgi:hypothetical protein
MRLRISSPLTHGSASSADADMGATVEKEEFPRPAKDESLFMEIAFCLVVLPIERLIRECGRRRF